MRITTTIAAACVLSMSSTAQAMLIFNADNEGFVVGTAPPITGAPDAPTSVDTNLILTVEDGSTVAGPNLGTDKFLRLAETAGEAPDFRYDGGTSYTSGVITLSMDLLFENLESYHVYFRESGSTAVSVANIFFNSNGSGSVVSLGGTSAFTYVAGVAYQLMATLNLDTELMDVSLNGASIASAQSIDDVFGSATIGFDFSGFAAGPNQDGVMQVDNFTMAANTVPEPSSLLLVAIGMLGVGAAMRRRRLPLQG